MSMPSSSQNRRTVGRTLRWVAVFPVLMVGSLLYWSVAIGLGGLSLMTASALSGSGASLEDQSLESYSDNENATLDVGGTPIMVHLEESEEPDDVNDNAGTAGFTAVSDDQQVIVAPGPGSTSY